ncbi:ABC transporter substrate-binding protein [Halobacteriovorax sp. HFRX-2_2]|uniref:ABC transporter substrate-binding protein n=1 Tax=unclassified Halobacteriovorax TaxID=2639665 RepID=UPI003724A07B
MKSRNLVSFLIMGLLTLTVSCTKKVDLSEKVLHLAVTSEVKGMDPIYSNDKYSSNEVGRVYEGLLEYHYLKRPYTLVPNLAESLPEVSEDGLTYTFKIKQGVLFHDDAAFKDGKGRELVAQDFVYSIKRLADPKLQGLGWWLLQDKIVGLDEWREKNSKKDTVDYTEVVEGLKTLDKYTLQFKLKKQFPQFLYSLAMPFTFVVAKEVVDHYGKEFLNHPVGTGPFMLKEFRQSAKKFTYEVNPNFRKKLFPTEASDEFKHMLKYAGKQVPFVKKIEVNIIKEDQPRWLNFLKGRVDYIGIPKDNFESAVTPGKGLGDEFAKKGIELSVSPSLDVTYTAFNHDLKLFHNVDLRRALALAYNVKEFNKLFYNDTALPAQSVVPPGIAGNMPDYVSPYRSRDLEKAKALLAKAGYPEGKGLPEITYDCPSSSTSRQIGELFKKQMAEIGVNIKVVQNSWPELQKKITARQVMLYGIAWGADYPDAENFLQLLYGPNRSPGANGSGYNNPKFNELFAKASIMQDSPERTAIYEQLNKMAAEEVPWLYGVHRQSYLIKHSWLRNYITTDFEAGQAQYLDIDLEAKKNMQSKL